jgi:hypothetical protein
VKGLRGVWLGLGALAYFAASLGWLNASRPLNRSAFAAGSVYNTSPDGLSLAYRYLRSRTGASVLARPLDPGEVEPWAVIFRARPRPQRPIREDPEEGEGGDQDEAKKAGAKDQGKKAKAKPKLAPEAALLTRAEENWVRGGGRLVLALAESLGPAQVEVLSGPRPPRAEKVFPLWEGVKAIYPEPRRVLAGAALQDSHAVFLLGERPLLARRPLDRGELFLLAAPEVLENGRLGQGDHLALLQALAGRDRPVYFDEHAHGIGSEPGLLALLLRLGFGPLLVLLVALGMAAFWRGRRRLGPAVDDHQESRSDAVDLLDSLGQFYDRSLRRDEAAFLYRQALARAVAYRTGLRGPALPARVASLAGPGGPPINRSAQDLSQAAFARALESSNHGFRRLQA